MLDPPQAGTKKRAPRFSNKTMQRAFRAVVRAGWRWERCKNGVLVYPPNGARPVPLHTSDRDGYRGTPNAVVQLRRAGLDLA